MKKMMAEIPVFVYTVKNHEEVKPELLRLIAETPSSAIDEKEDFIHNSDWYTPDGLRPYCEKMMEVFVPAFVEFQKIMKVESVSVINYWFQQYEKNGKHGWHVHPSSMYGVVYYVEMPDGSQPTNLLVNGQTVVPDAKEGDILFFPNILHHRSPKNVGAGRKTSLVMNLNFEGYKP